MNQGRIKFIRPQLPFISCLTGLVSIAGFVAACGGDGGGGGGKSGFDASTGGSPGGTGGLGGTDAAEAGVVDASVDAQVCTPGDQKDCYPGPLGTEGIGACHAGTQTCLSDGSDYGPCSGAVIPSAENCSASGDENCDGVVNEACVCTPGSTQNCYEGPPSTAGVGLCKTGSAKCSAEGNSIGPCEGQVVPSFDDCFSANDEDCDGVVASCAGNLLWSAHLDASGVSDATAIAQGVDIDNQGNVLVAGPFRGTLTPSGATSSITSAGGGHDTFVAKYSATGAHLWTQLIGGAGSYPDGEAAVVAADAAGNVIVAGASYGQIKIGTATYTTTDLHDIYVAKFDPNGTALWSEMFEGTYDDGVADIAVDSSGNILLLGQFGSGTSLGATIKFGGGADLFAVNSRAFVVKLNGANGAHIWSFQVGAFDNLASTYRHNLAVDSQGSVLVTAENDGNISFQNNYLPKGQYLYKYSPAGNPLWAKPFGGNGLIAAAAPNGTLAAAVSFSGTIDFGTGPLTSAGSADIAVLMLDSSGNVTKSKLLGGAGADGQSSLRFDAASNLIVAGVFSNSLDIDGKTLTSNGGKDMFFAKFSTSSVLGWATSFGGSTSESASRVVTDAKGNIVIGGSFTGSVTFGAKTYSAGGWPDGFVLKLSP